MHCVLTTNLYDSIGILLKNAMTFERNRLLTCVLTFPPKVHSTINPHRSCLAFMLKDKLAMQFGNDEGY